MLICFLLKFFSRRLIPSFGDDQAAEAEAALEKRPQPRIIKSSIHTVNNLSHVYYILHNTLHVFSFRLFFSVALQLIIKAQARWDRQCDMNIPDQCSCWKNIPPEKCSAWSARWSGVLPFTGAQPRNIIWKKLDVSCQLKESTKPTPFSASVFHMKWKRK